MKEMVVAAPVELSAEALKLTLMKAKMEVGVASKTTKGDTVDGQKEKGVKVAARVAKEMVVKTAILTTAVLTQRV